MLEGLRLGENCESHWPARDRRRFVEAEEREPVGTGVEGDEGWPSSSLVRFTVPMDALCGCHRNIRGTGIP